MLYHLIWLRAKGPRNQAFVLSSPGMALRTLHVFIFFFFFARPTDPPSREGGRWETKHFIGMALTVSWRRHSYQDRLLSRVLSWLLSRKHRRLVDLLFRALWDNNHSGLLDDTRLACLLRVANLLYSLLLVQLIKKVDVHNEDHPGNVPESLSKQQE